MPERRDVVEYEHVAVVEDGRQVRRRVDQLRATGSNGQGGLLPEVTGAMRESVGRSNHAVAIRAERRQTHRHLASETFDSPDLRAYRGSGIYRDWLGCGLSAVRHYALRRRQRRTIPPPSKATPTTTATQASN